MFKPLFSVVVLAVVLAGCSKPEPVPEPVQSVKVVTVGAVALLAAPEFAGTVQPRVESRLGFRVGGKMTQRPAQLGQRVKAGQVLAQLDAQDFRLAADAARAQVAAATTGRDLAAADAKRYAALRAQNFISGAELERRDSALAAAQAQLDQAQAQLSAQGNQAAYTALVADVAGVVTAVEAEPGQVVSAGTPVVRIAQDGARDVVFAVPEDQLALVRVGAVVAVQAWASEVVWQGVVREVAASADPVTRTFSVKVGRDASVAAALGTTVAVRPVAGAAGTAHAAGAVMKLPTSALRQEGAGSAVWVLEPASMTLRSQSVQVAAMDGNTVVIASGLTPGMEVVATGVHVLSAGQRVLRYQPRGAAVVPAAPVVQAVPSATQPVSASTASTASAASIPSIPSTPVSPAVVQ